MHLARLLFALCIPTLACCSSSSAGGTTPVADGGVDGGDLVGACDALASATCTREASCSAFFVQFGFGDEKGCETAVRNRCATLGVLAGVTWTASDVRACAAKLPATSCGDFFGGASPCSPPPGTEPIGAPCYYGEQCASGYCRTGSDQPCGACAALPAAGEACDTVCAEGQRCSRGTCVTASAEGAPCTAVGQCPITQGCFQGKCSALGKLGDPCDANSAAAPDCDFLSGLVCLAGSCVKIGLANPGAACGYGATGLTLCEAGGRCSPSPSSGTCQAPSPLGQPCSSTNGPPCVPGAICVSGVCRLPDATACR